jgi:hypothetical protein
MACIRLVALSFVLVGLMGCDSRESPAPRSGDPAAPAPAAAASSGRDLSSMNVCELVPGDVVEKLVTNKLRQPPQRMDMGPQQQGCEYYLGEAMQDTFEYVHIYVSTHLELFEPLEAALETERQLGASVTGEVLSGLGDEAYALHNEMSGDTSVQILKRGDVVVSVKANTLPHARVIAATVLKRLGR